jgi:hypothetical protein
MAAELCTFEQERIDEFVVERDACWVDFAKSSFCTWQVKHFWVGCISK